MAHGDVWPGRRGGASYRKVGIVGYGWARCEAATQASLGAPGLVPARPDLVRTERTGVAEQERHGCAGMGIPCTAGAGKALQDGRGKVWPGENRSGNAGLSVRGFAGVG